MAAEMVPLRPGMLADRAVGVQIEQDAHEVSIMEIASRIRQTTTENGKAVGSRAANAPVVTEGLMPEDMPFEEGLHLVTPEQLLSLRVNRLAIRAGEILGFQRELTVNHARNIARRLTEGDLVPPILYAIDEHGTEVFDGQHRAVGAIISRVPIWAVGVYVTPEQRAQLFADQRRAKT